MRYAAYGSNLHPQRLNDRISSAQLITTGFLPNWFLHFHKRSDDESGKGNILTGGDGVHFAIFEISAKDKRALNEIEGVGYTEIVLCIPDLGDCVSYVAEESHIDNSLLPYDWYKELVLIGARFHGFPDEYLQRIESTQALHDPDPGRRVERWKMVELVRKR